MMNMTNMMNTLNLPVELIYLLIFAGIVLFQFLMKRFMPQPSLPQIEPAAEAPPPEHATPEATSAATRIDTQFGRSAPPVSFPAPGQRRFSRTALIGNKRNAQNAIVTATIIGPCRAFDPHDIR